MSQIKDLHSLGVACALLFFLSMGNAHAGTLRILSGSAYDLPILMNGDQDGDGISDADEGLVCLPVTLRPDVTTPTPNLNCGSNADRSVTFRNNSPSSIVFGGTCDGAWNSTLNIQLNNLVPGVPVTFRLSVINSNFGNPKQMFATITGFGGLNQNVVSGGGVTQGGGSINHTFTPAGTTATGRMTIRIDGVGGFGGDIFVYFENFQQVVTPDPNAPEDGSGGPTCNSVDTDGDGIPDHLDLDSDNDGILDSEELNDDTDGDGIGDWRDLDSDNDGISDLVEGGLDPAEYDPDGNGHIDGVPFVDADRDGIADALELFFGEDQGSATFDTDGDGLLDYIDLDSDGDGIPDTIEAFPTVGYSGNDGNVTDDDADGDGIIDLFDSNDGASSDFGGSFTEPEDTDGDGIPDYLDTNSDQDAFLDADEGGATVTDVSYADPNGSVNVPENDLPDERNDTDEVAYRESCAPVIDVLPDVTVCADEGYILPNLTNGEYFTEPNGGGERLTAGERIETTSILYVFLEEPGFGCSAENPFTVTMNGFDVVAQIGDDQTICEDTVPSQLDEVSVPQATGIITYQWQQSTDGTLFTDIIGANESIFNPPALNQDHWFKRVDTTTLNGNSCMVETNTVRITINRFTELGTIGEDQVVCNGSIPEPITQSLATEANGELSYQWQQSTDGSSFTDIPNANDEGYAPPALFADTWFQRVDTSLLNGMSCVTITNSVMVTVLGDLTLPQPTVRVLACAPSTNGYGLEISLDTLAITGGSGTLTDIRFITDNGTPNDTTDDRLLQSGSSPAYIEYSYGQQTITIEVEDGSGCAARTSALLQQRFPLNANVGADHGECIYDGFGRITIEVMGGVAPYYTSINSTAEEDFEQDRFVFDGLESGTNYMVYIMDANNCEIAIPVELESPPQLDFSVNVSYNCDTGTNNLRNKVDIIVDLEEVPDAIFDIDGAGKYSSLESSFTDLIPGDYFATISYKNGCISEPLEFSIKEIPTLDIEVATNEINKVSITAFGGSGDYEYRFEDAAFGSKNTFIITKSGSHTLYARDALGCEVSQEVYLEFIPVRIPDYFTPNGDINNEGWSPQNLEPYPAAITEVYDRYGRHITTLESYQKWDGYYDGMPLPSGDYWYILYLNDPNAISIDPIMGNFTLYR